MRRVLMLTRPLGLCAPRRRLSTAALERAPCLQCGGAKSPASPVCAVSGLRVACSERCAESLASERRKLLLQFRSAAEDAAFGASDDAKLLFAQAKRATPLHGVAQRVGSWHEFLQLFTSDERWLANPPALRLLSAAYSYVMTLAHYLPALRQASGSQSADVARIHVIGARAEATMPRHLWDELPFFHPSVRAFDVTLVGDHVPAVRQQQQKPPQPSSSAAPEAEPRGRVVRLETINGLYHEPHVVERTRAMPPPDALVLFNPGVGHPFLKARWRPTLAALLASGKPILLSSFSQADQDRDVAALGELRSECGELAFLVSPQSNPFRSLKCQIDPLHLLAPPIRTNSHVIVVQKAQ
ncbi:hypothetical protein PybrP1_002456 [[Pythium] brassicae (nom. inval.)]|nr:hypothetical protein PybrP1_002456 [[Pythium] brassicae (nom. inval.)]